MSARLRPALGESDGNAPRRMDERGLVSTELAVLMPVLFVLALLAIFVAHVGRHSSRTQQAADAAARAASLAVDEVDAELAALRAAQAVCHGPVSLDSFVYQAPQLLTSSGDSASDPFTPGLVAVDLTCRETFSGFGALGGNGERIESAAAVSVIEYWREW